MAGHLVATLELDQLWDHLLAGAGDSHRAPRREGTARGQITRVGRFTTDDRALP